MTACYYGFMRKLASLMIALAALPVTAAAQQGVHPRPKAPDCYCTDRTGQRVELGQEICLIVDGRAFMASCQMSLNNPIWRDTGRNCLSSDLRPTRELPRLQSLAPTL